MLSNEEVFDVLIKHEDRIQEVWGVEDAEQFRELLGDFCSKTSSTLHVIARSAVLIDQLRSVEDAQMADATLAAGMTFAGMMGIKGICIDGNES